jgi:pathogenesis-related protein 1
MPAPEPALPPVTWDPVLADVAYDYLSRCPSPDGVFTEHNPHATEDYAALGGSGWVGENIWGTSGDAYTAAEVVADWMSEAPDYDHASNTSSGVTGHYTQVVWRASTRIGCAWVVCPELEFGGLVLCNYSPGGNDGSRPY